MARRVVILEEKIEKVQINVAETKVKYDKAVDELEKLLMKRKERDNKQLLKAFSESERKPLQKSLNSCKGISRQKIERYITIDRGRKSMMTLTQYKKVIKSLTRDELEAHLFEIFKSSKVFKDIESSCWNVASNDELMASLRKRLEKVFWKEQFSLSECKGVLNDYLSRT